MTTPKLNKKHVNSSPKGLITIIVVILLLIMCSLFLNSWTFSYYELRVASIIITPFLYFSLLPLLFYVRYREPKMVIGLGITCFLFASCNSYINIKPIDSHSPGRDILVLRKDGDVKQVVQQNFSYKQNRVQYDTLFVKDYFIFRRIMQ